MNRFAIAVLSIVGGTFLMLGSAPGNQTRPAPAFHSKHLDVTGFDGASVRYDASDGSFSFRGTPTLHAVMPLKKMTLDAGAVTGHIDQAAGSLKDAVLIGGVHGTLDVDSKNGINKISFTGVTVHYSDKGAATAPAPDLDAAGGTTFQSANSTAGSKFLLKGSHGLFHLRSLNGELSLAQADLDGPVTFSFSGVTVGADKKKQPSRGHGTAGHLRITRAGTDYEIHLSGGVHVVGSGAGNDVDLTVQAGMVVVDQTGNFKSFAGDEPTSGTITPNKHAA